MRTLPDREMRSVSNRRLPLLVALLFMGCGVALQQPPPLKQSPVDRTAAFLRTRAQPPPPPPIASDRTGEAAAEDAAKADQTVDVTGAVDRPGQLVIGPYVQTMRQAVDAMGGLNRSAVMLRIRPGDDALSQLIAQTDATNAIEIPIDKLNDATPIYVRHGDVIEVVGAGPVPVSSSTATEIGQPELAAAAPTESATTKELELLTGVSQAAPSAELPPAVEPEKLSSAADSARADVDAFREEMETKLRDLREDVEKLREENVKLRAQLADVARPAPTSASVATAAVRKPAPVVEARPAEPAPRAPSVEKERPAPKTADAKEGDTSARPATVLVSGSVKKPGMYPIDQVKTVRGAVRAAGDRNDSNLQAVEVRPEAQRGPLLGIGLGLGSARTVVDLVAVEAGKGRDVTLRGGEVIFVPPAKATERQQ